VARSHVTYDYVHDDHSPIQRSFDEGEYSFTDDSSARAMMGLTNNEYSVQADPTELAVCGAAATGLNDDRWYIDSGATAHMTSPGDWFYSSETPKVKQVVVGGGKSLPVTGQGSIKLLTADGRDFLLTHVLFVPSLGASLISTSDLDAQGYC
jgi:hypothetical protein